MAMRRAQADDAADRGERKTPVPARQYQPVPLRAIAPVMRSAALIGEDHRFYEHAGIDYVEFRHALGYRPDDFSWSNPGNRAELERALRRLWKRRGSVRGASTITQQLAMNLFLSTYQTPCRKINDAMTTWR